MQVLRSKEEFDIDVVKTEVDMLVLNYSQLRVNSEKLQSLDWLAVSLDERCALALHGDPRWDTAFEQNGLVRHKARIKRENCSTVRDRVAAHAPAQNLRLEHAGRRVRLNAAP